ncbi:MAG: transglutaminase-like domain-containing protein [Candidatus Coatesbacteria bacterium]
MSTAPRRDRRGRGRPSSTLRIVLLAGAALGLFLLLVHARLVVSLRNGRLIGAAYRLAEEDFHHPRLRLLRARERLDGVVAPYGTQFDQILALRGWVHRQWAVGKRFYYPPWDAVEILDLARTQGNRGFCAQYAVVFLQACQSFGIHARYVNLPGHFVVSVWSDTWDQWVVMDPQNDLHFERAGVPLGARALSDAVRRNAPGGIVVAGPGAARRPAAESDLVHYRSISIVMDADQLSRPVRYARDGTVRTLIRRPDYTEYPLVGRDTLVFWNRYLVWKAPASRVPAGEAPVLPGTLSSSREDFDYPKNQTVILTQNSVDREDTIDVGLLAEQSETFSAFEVRAGGGRWTESPARFRWILKPGLNRLSCRIRTSFGWLGPESHIAVLYWPSML